MSTDIMGGGANGNELDMYFVYRYVLLNISVTEESSVYHGQRREQIDLSRKNSKPQKPG
uniref:Uncharacterized protein n=1 Tax=Arion vulgaris TaxID=1028688 RepID=A0A0B7BSY3_9EUPU